MDFRARKLLPDYEPPGKAYVFGAGLKTVYGNSHEAAFAHAERILKSKQLKELFRAADINWFIAVAWGRQTNNKPAKMLDVFGFSGLEGWPGNPDVYAWVAEKSTVKAVPNITCGDALMMLGKEERFRRSCRSLEDFLKGWPD